MLKVVLGFVVGVALTIATAVFAAGSFMFNEFESPFGVEETAARIQANIEGLSEEKGWKLSALRDPAKAVAASGGNVLPVLLVEACSTAYSKPLLKEDDTRILSILMPCSISIYKKDDGKTYIGLMNAGLMGKLFGTKVASIMDKVAEDQAQFIKFDPKKPAPPL
ncbi:DUF302 domain-containing protein [Solemya velesiana gill symbiont]|uniref:DUF302 domain-containing protein n=1 Tax=Solemya velesiana gill symbiont TaxID=1918948 RepID=A0A1T2KTB2_9GAMM|nr:DUF302 domain-containing protein [Solemya velesiana gill symbiont]OOZ35970.1 hypothetical protein BOW51_09530 [Solemya velesiana gill symbiont]